MSSLYIAATWNGNNPAVGKTCAAYKTSLFVQGPQSLAQTPSQTPDNQQTTDGSGFAQFTGLSVFNDYWVMIVDSDGNHWTKVSAAKVGNTSGTRVLCPYVIAQAGGGLINGALGNLAIWAISA